MEAVRERGDAAVAEYTARFDGVKLDKLVLRVAVRRPAPSDSDSAHTLHHATQDLPEPVLSPEVKAAFDVAFSNISAFHSAQRKTAPLDVETMPGVRCRRITRPIGAPARRCDVAGGALGAARVTGWRCEP